MYSVNAETVLSFLKGIGGVILGLILVIFVRFFLSLCQGYLNKLIENRKRKNIEEKYDFLKEKIVEQRLYIKIKFKDSDQLGLLQEHLKKLELEELKTEIDKIEELKATN
ncbi:hypothetical protein [Niastella yeongjuensis]|nr:hypothetical protein [Niastella yeongjuensis]